MTVRDQDGGFPVDAGLLEDGGNQLDAGAILDAGIGLDADADAGSVDGGSELGACEPPSSEMLIIDGFPETRWHRIIQQLDGGEGSGDIGRLSLVNLGDRVVVQASLDRAIEVAPDAEHVATGQGLASNGVLRFANDSGALLRADVYHATIVSGSVPSAYSSTIHPVMSVFRGDLFRGETMLVNASNFEGYSRFLSAFVLEDSDGELLGPTWIAARHSSPGAAELHGLLRADLSGGLVAQLGEGGGLMMTADHNYSIEHIPIAGRSTSIFVGLGARGALLGSRIAESTGSHLAGIEPWEDRLLMSVSATGPLTLDGVEFAPPTSHQLTLILANASLEPELQVAYEIVGEEAVPWSLASVGEERCFSLSSPFAVGEVVLHTGLGAIRYSRGGERSQGAILCLNDRLEFTKAVTFETNLGAQRANDVSLAARERGGFVASVNFVDTLSVVDATGAIHIQRSRCRQVVSAGVVRFDVDGRLERIDSLCGCGDTSIASIASIEHDDDVIVLFKFESSFGLREGPVVNSSRSPAFGIVRLHPAEEL